MKRYFVYPHAMSIVAKDEEDALKKGQAELLARLQNQEFRETHEFGETETDDDIVPVFVMNKISDVPNLLAWRDQNNDLVRELDFPHEQGIIKYGPMYEHYFHKVNNFIQFEHFPEGDIARKFEFTYDIDTWEIKSTYFRSDIEYSKEQALQDLVTVTASMMAYIKANPEKVVEVENNVYEVQF